MDKTKSEASLGEEDDLEELEADLDEEEDNDEEEPSEKSSDKSNSSSEGGRPGLFLSDKK